MAREPIQTWYFTLVVVHLEDRFLLVQERKYEKQWYLPTGRVEKGETLLDAAMRNTVEEAGISVIIEGILRVETTVMPRGNVRLRVIFVLVQKIIRRPRASRMSIFCALAGILSRN